jgi:hypothetical protein
MRLTPDVAAAKSVGRSVGGKSVVSFIKLFFFVAGTDTKYVRTWTYTKLGQPEPTFKFFLLNDANVCTTLLEI